MKASFQRIPVDLVLCMGWTVVLVLLALFNVDNSLRLILGGLFILFIPGYVLVFALFPFKKHRKGISVVERIALSLGMSVAIVPLFGLGLNFSPWGIRLVPLLLVLCLFIFSVGSIALYRWFTTIPAERFCISLDMSLPRFENRLSAALTLLLVTLIIISVTLLLYVIIVPKVGEKYTEFYVLDSNGKADQYPQNLSRGENDSVNASVILGISNHEYRKITYTVEVWLIEENTSFNAYENYSKTVIDHMWFVDEITIELNHMPVNIENPWEPQWEENYSFSLYRVGSFKLAFLLFTTPTEHYTLNKDYQDAADQIINTAYREIHLWVTIV